MEFSFNLNDVFKSSIVEITPNLIPPGYAGDRRALWDTVSKVGEIVNQMGAASAAAQGLNKAITTADRIRNSEHKLYFLIDQKANSGKGAVTGMLKTGNKSLYVFDRDGNHYQVQPPCLLDFYVHESKQRNGLGKVLFEHMLQKEGIAPVQMAIDRPSEKLLGFLNKHYSLRDPVKQMNNYVVFDDFFPRRGLAVPEPQQEGGLRNKNNPNSANGLQPVPSPMGRYGAPRPPCSMGQIIHNQSPSDKSNVQKEPEHGNQTKLERPRSLVIQQDTGEADQDDVDKDSLADPVDVATEELDVEEPVEEKIRVRGATENFLCAEFATPSPRKNPSHLTEKGYVDLKFYHNKLW